MVDHHASGSIRLQKAFASVIVPFCCPANITTHDRDALVTAVAHDGFFCATNDRRGRNPAGAQGVPPDRLWVDPDCDRAALNDLSDHYGADSR